MANYFFIEINFLSELLIEIATDIRVVIGAEILIALPFLFSHKVSVRKASKTNTEFKKNGEV